MNRIWNCSSSPSTVDKIIKSTEHSTKLFLTCFVVSSLTFIHNVFPIRPGCHQYRDLGILQILAHWKHSYPPRASRTPRLRPALRQIFNNRSRIQGNGGGILGLGAMIKIWLCSEVAIIVVWLVFQFRYSGRVVGRRGKGEDKIMTTVFHFYQYRVNYESI